MSASYISIPVSALAAMRIHGLRDDAHIADSRLFDGVHDGREGAKRHIFVGAQINGLMLRIANLLLQGRSDLVDVDGIVAEKYFLRFIDTDHQPLFGYLFDGARVRNVDFDAGLKHGRGHHENNEENENDIDERRDVDVGQRGLGASVGRGEGHQRRASPTGICRSAGCVWRATILSISSARSSLREAISRMEPMMRL